MKKKLFYGFIILAVIGHFYGDDQPSTTNVNVTPPTQLERSNTAPISNTQIKKNKQTTNPPPTKTDKTTVKSTIMYVDASSLRVRAGPTINTKQVWNLKRDQAVSTYQREGDWVFVKGERFSGWVHGGYLTPNKAKREAQPVQQAKPKLSNQKIINILISRSLGQYRRNCPCPYNSASNGSRCGKRSAYSRPGGASPLCYPSDISRGMIADYRSRQ